MGQLRTRRHGDYDAHLEWSRIESGAIRLRLNGETADLVEMGGRNMRNLRGHTWTRLRIEEIDPNIDIERRIEQEYEWAEGPVYFPEGDYVLWSDIPNNRMLKFDAIWKKRKGREKRIGAMVNNKRS